MDKSRVWKVFGGKEIVLDPFLIVGILNITPDSFFDGGRFFDTNRAVEHAKDMLRDGAHVIDIGGESTRPFSKRVDVEEEKSRVIPVLEALTKSIDGVIISIDTYKARVAEEAIKRGALIINDVSACRFDPHLLDIISEYKPGYVLMHSLGRPEDMQKDPKYHSVVDELLDFFEQNLKKLTDAGLPEENIVIDPGIGFGKLLEHNLEILKNITRFYSLGRPVYMGLSNKSMWEKLLGLKVGERGVATQVATGILALKGVLIHRVHDVKLTKDTLCIVQGIG